MGILNGILQGFNSISLFLLFICALLIILLIVIVAQRLARKKILKGKLCDFEFSKTVNLNECKKYIKILAKQQVPTKNRRYNLEIRFLIEKAEKHINELRECLRGTHSSIISLVPAARWLFDNFYMVSREIMKEENDITGIKKLPVIIKGENKGYPRIFVLARAIILRLGAHLTKSNIDQLIEIYQKEDPLTSSELIILPDLLGLCLIEGIVQTADKILEVIQFKTVADAQIKQIINHLNEGEDIVNIITQRKDALNASCNITCIAHVLYALKKVAINKIELNQCAANLTKDGGKQLTLAEVFSEERKFETELESNMRSLIGSLQALRKIDTTEMFEKHSLIEKELKNDPSNIYSKMDDNSRNLYRWEIEKLSHKYKVPEWEVAKKVVSLAQRKRKKDETLHLDHVGTYLFGEGREALKAKLLNRKQEKPKNGRDIKRVMYFTIIALLSILLFTVLLGLINFSSVDNQTLCLIFLIISIIPVFSAAIEITNYIYNFIVPTSILPALDFTKKIPSAYKTIVVMPIILTDAKQVKRYIFRMEKYYLANDQTNLSFAILGDFKDAPNREMEQDKAIIEASRIEIEKLNKKYPTEKNKFNLFVRYRQWNEKESCWMGWERKRGKLEEFNALVCGEKDTSYMLMQRQKKMNLNFKYAITIDADTDLIRGSAAKFVGIISHPLNQPVVDPVKKKIIRGFAIIQSEIRNHVFSLNSSVFSKIFSGNQGFDPYSSAVSDIYQDTFEAGIFLGKGIYDIKVMHQLLHKTLPENTVLSHDLLESCYARTAFASGVKLMDSFPSSVIAYIKREHRWIRGDWQLLPWLFGKAPLDGLSRWKIFDNMRRSTIALFRLAIIIMNAFLLPKAFYLWVPIVFFSDIIRIVHMIAKTFKERAFHPSSKIAWKSFLHGIYTIFEQAAIRFIILPYRAYISLDAIIRTLYRLAISHKQLLEWETTETVEQKTPKTLSKYFADMWIVIFPALLIGLAAYIVNMAWIEVIDYILIASLWAASPAIAYAISLAGTKQSKIVLNADDQEYLRIIAKKTGQYFKDFSKPEYNYLCPDNFQLIPSEKVSLKTSPTNIGMQLLSFLSRWDLGFSGLISCVNDIEKTMNTIKKLQKWNGHLFNWYDIETLEVLPLQYVSTVDSGNFIAGIIALKNGLIDLCNRPIFSSNTVAGLSASIKLSGIDAAIPENIYSKEMLVSFIQDIYDQFCNTRRQAWESEKWTDSLMRLCEEYLEDAELFHEPDILLYGPKTLKELAESGPQKAINLFYKIENMICSMEEMINKTDFSLLFDSQQRLFRIGYNEAAQRFDSGCYDLMASEAMLTSFLAIAKNDVPHKHWQQLGRPQTMINGVPVFVSWSGTMFEYLLPNLILKEFPISVFSNTARSAIDAQIAYGKKQNIPWGISESQYYRFDVNSNYQYKAFGISKLRQQPSFNEPLVVSPYSTFLAAQFKPTAAMKNIRELQKLNAEGDYGFYEALDYNSPDAENILPFSIVKSFMAHHQGMSLVSINNLLNDNIMRRRFHRDAIVKSAEILLEEIRMSHIVSISRKGFAIDMLKEETYEEQEEPRLVTETSLKLPRSLWISNNRYSLMVTSDGDGFSRCGDTMLNRWRADLSAEAGQYIYIKDVDTKEYWSSAYKPTLKKPDKYQVIFSNYKAEFIRRDGELTTKTDITISPSNNIEFRKITITNHSDTAKMIETTSYQEVVMDEFLAGLYHPAFNKLFMESEYIEGQSLLLCKRRKSENGAQSPYMIHMAKTTAKKLHKNEYETDRLHFIGRNKNLKNPDLICENLPLGNRSGFSTDPILSIRVCVEVPARKSVDVTYITGVCPTKEAAISLSEDYEDSYLVDEAFEQFKLNSELELKYLSINNAQLNAIQELIGPIFYPTKAYRASEKMILGNTKSQGSLWQFGISGDNPIILYHIKSVEEADTVKDVLQAYEYMRLNNINVDLVLLNEEEFGYFQDVGNMLNDIVAALRIYVEGEEKPSLFIINSSHIDEKDKNLLFTVARVVISEESGIYFRSVLTKPEEKDKRDKEELVYIHSTHISQRELPKAKLEFYNGFGGFSKVGKEYEIYINEKHKTPMPWVNVIANDNFGFITSESGGGYTWAVNSSDNKLTSWSNDPVTDPVSEAVYIQDKKSGDVCSPVCIEGQTSGWYHIRHGFGYSVFAHEESMISQEMTVFVPLEDSVKLWKVSLRNDSNENKELKILLYLQWDLGTNRQITAPYICTQYNADEEYLSARNVYGDVYWDSKAFVFSSEKVISFTGDRMEFLNAKKFLDNKRCRDVEFSNTFGAGYDPCGVVQVSVSLAAGQEKKIIFGLGYSDSDSQIIELCNKYRNLNKADNELDKVKDYWKKITQKIVVSTNDRALDFMVNGWLLYQTISCRIKARSAFYQAGGAFGFRDQLQDVLALMDITPEAVKAQILLACSRQFKDGDVQHWWHAPTGLGIRTRITDDLLWLPYVVCEYIKSTGDSSILDFKVPYIEGPALLSGENEKMFIPNVSDEKGSVYEHCVKAIKHVGFGIHGLPLIGGGDWNDGMNRVGIMGKGESVWMGWFVHSILSNFTDICMMRNDNALAKNLKSINKKLINDIEENAWDGEWYIRAFYDDGTKLGSRENEECRIDSISQSWGVISNGANKERAALAMSSAEHHLVRPQESVIMLLAPPFNKTRKNPGYIKDYFPGVRENGGQYTHAAIWLAIAKMMQGHHSTSYRLLNSLNPIYITSTQRDAIRYEKEPYVLAGDIYMAETYKGHAGWSWYTGSSGWMYQAMLKWFLGLHKEGDRMLIKPAVPTYFGEYTIRYKYGQSIYVIEIPNIVNSDYHVSSIIMDNNKIDGNSFRLADDKQRHYINIVID